MTAIEKYREEIYKLEINLPNVAILKSKYIKKICFNRHWSLLNKALDIAFNLILLIKLMFYLVT